MAPVVTMRQLLESGVHFGHQTRRWNPKMKRFILAERNGIYIIDLQQSLDFIDTAYEFIKETVAHGGSILYVGTKKQAQEAIAEQARRVGHAFRQPALAGRHADELLRPSSSGCSGSRSSRRSTSTTWPGSGMTKKELLQLRRERDKLERSLGGIRDMARVPSAIWVVDTKKEHIAVSEARKLGIPVIAILDTNCDPDEVTYPIPGNDDAIRSVALLTRVVADAVADGLIARAGAADGEEKPSAAPTSGELGAEEPLAEWELAVLEGKGSDDAAAQNPEAQNPEAAAPEAASHRAGPRRDQANGTAPEHEAPAPSRKPRACPPAPVSRARPEAAGQRSGAASPAPTTKTQREMRKWRTSPPRT